MTRFHRVQTDYSDRTPLTEIPWCATTSNLAQLVTLAEGSCLGPSFKLIRNRPFAIVKVAHAEDSYVFSTVLLRADLDKELREGTTVSLDVTEVKDGKTTKYTVTRVYKTLEKDRIVMVYHDRKTPEGAALSDITFTMTRK